MLVFLNKTAQSSKFSTITKALWLVEKTLQQFSCPKRVRGVSALCCGSLWQEIPMLYCAILFENTDSIGNIYFTYITVSTQCLNVPLIGGAKVYGSNCMHNTHTVQCLPCLVALKSSDFWLKLSPFLLVLKYSLVKLVVFLLFCLYSLYLYSTCISYLFVFLFWNNHVFKKSLFCNCMIIENKWV